MKKILGYLLLVIVLISMYIGFAFMLSIKLQLWMAFLIALIPFVGTALVYGFAALLTYLICD